MAALALKSSHTEQRAVVHLLWAKGHNTSAIHSEMRPVYGDKCFMRPAIHASCKKFACGRESIDDKKRPGWHVVATTDAMTATINKFVWSDRCMSISDTVHHTGISRHSMHRIQSKIISNFQRFVLCGCQNS